MKQQVMPTIAILLIVLGLCWYVDHIAHKEISNAVKFTLYTIVAALVVTLLGVLTFATLIIRERLLKERANRQLAEREMLVHGTTLLSEERLGGHAGECERRPVHPRRHAE